MKGFKASVVSRFIYYRCGFAPEVDDEPLGNKSERLKEIFKKKLSKENIEQWKKYCQNSIQRYNSRMAEFHSQLIQDCDYVLENLDAYGMRFIENPDEGITCRDLDGRRMPLNSLQIYVKLRWMHYRKKFVRTGDMQKDVQSLQDIFRDLHQQYRTLSKSYLKKLKRESMLQFLFHRLFLDKPSNLPPAGFNENNSKSDSDSDSSSEDDENSDDQNLNKNDDTTHTMDSKKARLSLQV